MTTPNASTSYLTSLPSPRSDSFSAAASDAGMDDHIAGPARKRARTEMTSEERKEARAHRNRIAAQNSRDRRKVQFGTLQQRVNELEEENRQLRAGMGLDTLRASGPRASLSTANVERAKWVQENEELKARIKTLESGWDAIVKALAAQGLPMGMPGASSAPPPTPTSAQAPPTPAPTVSERTPSPASPEIVPSSPAAYPVFVPRPPLHHLARLVPFASLAPRRPEFRHVRVRGVLRVRSPPSTGGDSRRTSVGSPAAGGPETSSLGRDGHPTNELALDLGAHAPAVDEKAMEDLLREILAPSPRLAPAALPLPDAPEQGTVSASAPAMSAAGAAGAGAEVVSWEWDVRDGEEEMQRLLEMLPAVEADAGVEDIVVDLDLSQYLDPASWDLPGCSVGAVGDYSSASLAMAPGVGVF